jgi:hypothetical protein
VPAPAKGGVQYTPPQVQAPVVPYAVPTTEESATPLWVEKPRQGISMYLFAGAAVVVLIMAMMALNSLNIVRMPWQSSDEQTQAGPTPSPMPSLTSRSEYARAERLVKSTLTPAMAELKEPFSQVLTVCYDINTTCRDSVTTSDQRLKKVIAVIDRSDIPPCMALRVGYLRTDLVQMDAALQLVLKGIADNQKSVAAEGMSHFSSLTPVLSTDATAVIQAANTQCSTDTTGP